MKDSIIPQIEAATFSEVRTRGGIWYDNSGDDFRVQRSLHEADFFMPHYHMHTTYEVHFAITGHTELECGTQKVELHAPYIAIHRPYIPHRLCRKFEDHPYFRYVLNFTEDFLSRAVEWVPDIEKLFPHSFFALELQREMCDRLQPYLENTFRLYAESRWETSQLAAALLLADMAAVLPDSRTMAQGGRIRYMDEVIRYIMDHISEKLICGDVAAQFFVSESKLAMDFRKSFGLTFNQFLMQLRVKMAKDMLAQGASAAETAGACGFCSSSYFIKVFRSYVGQTPAEFGRSLQ